jgi:hypothetical protein
MKQYLLTVIEPSGAGQPPAEELEKIMRDVGAVDQEMREKGVWVFAGGLHSPSTATTLRPQDGEVLATDGPFVEGKEYLGGISIIEADDLDDAMGWAGRIARATTLPIEVRPFYDEH